VALNPLRVRREKRERELQELEAFQSVRRAAREVADPEGRRSYQDLVDAARVAALEQSPEQRVITARHQQKIDQGRSEYQSGGN
jgi:hypothetical protein